MKRSRSIYGAGSSALTPSHPAPSFAGRAKDIITLSDEITRLKAIIEAQAKHIVNLEAKLTNIRLHVLYLNKPLTPRPLARQARKGKGL